MFVPAKGEGAELIGSDPGTIAQRIKEIKELLPPETVLSEVPVTENAVSVCGNEFNFFLLRPRGNTTFINRAKYRRITFQN